jgi:Protein of unknown function (DUF3592)
MRSKRARIDRQSKELIRELVKLNSFKTVSLKTEEQRSLIRERMYLIFAGGIMIVLPVLVGAWLLSVGFSSYRAAADFGSKAISTTGAIVETKSHTYTAPSVSLSAPSSHTYYVYTVQFQTEQGQIAKLETKDICPSRQPSLCNGRKVQVLYAFDNPQLAMVKGGDSPLDKARNNIGWGIFMLLTGIFTFIEYSGLFGLTRRRS